MTTTNMALTLPTVSVTLGPTWATYINTALTTIDEHDHTSGKGVLVPVSGIHWNANINVQAYSITNCTSFVCKSLTGSLTTPASIHNVNGDLYWVSSSGTPVQITSGTGLNFSSLGTIGGDFGAPGVAATVTYTDSSKIFAFSQSSGVPAKMWIGDIQLTYPGAGENSVTIKAATGSAAHSMTVPSAAPTNNDAAIVADSSGVQRYKVIAGTANQVVVTSTATGLTFSTPQSINTTSSPTFVTVTGSTSFLTPLLDTASGVALEIGKTTATSLNLSRTGVMTTVKGTLNVDEATTLDTTLAVTGNTTLSALDASKLVATNASKVLESITYSINSVASTMAQRGSDKFITCDGLNVISGGTAASAALTRNSTTWRIGGTISTITEAGVFTGTTGVFSTTLTSPLLDSAGALEIGKTNATSLNFSKSGVMTTVKGTLNVDEAVTLDSTLGVSGAITNSSLSTGIVHCGSGGLFTSSAIVNADIDASAAIVDSKLATISTSGKVSNSATTATDANTASAIVARDIGGDFSAGKITATGMLISGLTASYAVATDSSKNLISLRYTSSNIANTLVLRDASGDFSANIISCLTSSVKNLIAVATVGDAVSGTVISDTDSGVVGVCTGGGYGVKGTSTTGSGVYGYSATSGYGVLANAVGNHAVYGTVSSDTYAGVVGVCTGAAKTGFGVKGLSTAGTAISGVASNGGIGVYAESTGGTALSVVGTTSSFSSGGALAVNLNSATGNDCSIQFKCNTTNKYTLTYKASDGSLYFYNNTTSKLALTISASDAVTIGAASGTQTHTVNGFLSVIGDGAGTHPGLSCKEITGTLDGEGEALNVAHGITNGLTRIAFVIATAFSGVKYHSNGTQVETYWDDTYFNVDTSGTSYHNQPYKVYVYYKP